MLRKVLYHLFGTLALTGCHLISPMQEVSFLLPEPPEELRPCLCGTWTLELCSLSGSGGSRELDWSAGLPDQLALSRIKGEDLLILLTPPSTGPGRGFRPAGAWLPFDRQSAEAAFSRGSAVSIVTSLVGAGISMEGFHMDRFLREMEELKEPWNIDRPRLMRQLGRHEMRSWYIHERKKLKTSFTLPAGSWYSADPDLPPLHSSGAVLELSLSEGYHLFLCPERRESAELQVDDHGKATLLISSFSSP